jgi:AraC-like DNA-binding protein
MLNVRFSRPAPGLEQFVRFYVQREVQIPGAPVIHPVPARPATMIEFQFSDPVDVLDLDNGMLQPSPLLVVVGPQTYRRRELHLRGTLKHFVVMFQPDGLQRLHSLPIHELTNQAYDAHSVLGSSISHIWQILGNLQSFEDRVRVANEWLLHQSRRCPGADGISDAAHQMILTGGCIDLPALADRAGLSTRQFDRRFIRQVGMRPKLFARIARFEAALETKACSATRSWTDVAHEFGYYDQMHMIHDFEEFTGGTPTGILTQLEAVFAERIRQMRSCKSLPSSRDSRLML